MMDYDNWWLGIYCAIIYGAFVGWGFAYDPIAGIIGAAIPATIILLVFAPWIKEKVSEKRSFSDEKLRS